MAVVLHCLLIQSVRRTAFNSSVLSGILRGFLSVHCIFLMSWYRGGAEGEVLVVYRTEWVVDFEIKEEFRDVLLRIRRGFFKPSMNFVDSIVRVVAGRAGE